MLITPLAPMRLATQVPVLEGSAFDLALLMVGDGIAPSHLANQHINFGADLVRARTWFVGVNRLT
jgi:hypothetical protein